MAKIYVASSWRNEIQPSIVRTLREAGHEVYDFHNPAPGNHGFGWRQVAKEEPPWSAEDTRKVLTHPISEDGFAWDYNAMCWADTILMVQPCGRSAAIELGWGAGAGKRTIVLLADKQEPELMLKVADSICTSIEEVCDVLRRPQMHPSACVILMRDGKFAAIRSAKHGGSLELPGGKANRYGWNKLETPEENARRECEEEVGVAPTLNCLLLRSPVGGYDCYTFLGEISPSDTLASSSEGEAVWVTAEELLTGTYADHTRIWLEMLKRRGIIE